MSSLHNVHMPGFAELAARSHYSFLEGAASPKVIVETAARLGISALGLCDRNGLYGAVELIQAAKAQGIHPIIGTELELAGGSRIRLLARSRTGYRQLCRAVSAAQLAGVKGQPRLEIDGVSPGAASGSPSRQSPHTSRRPTLAPPERPAALRPTAGPFPEGWPGLPSATVLVESDPARVDPSELDDCIAIIGGSRSAVVDALVHGDRREALRHSQLVRECFGRERTAMLVSNHLHPADRWLVAECAAIARAADIPLVASATPDHATAGDKPLLDVLTAIRHRTTLDQAAAHGLLLPNSEHRLHGEAELRALLPDLPEAFDNAARIAAACEVSLDFSDVRFPGYPVPKGETPFSVLYRLCQEAVQRKYHPMTRAVAARLQRELDVIEKTRLAEFFLITWDIMRFAREHGIPGQGRGSAADSIVAYLLGVTRVDPVAHDLLFERFLHEDHQGTPDIDIDFSTDHREQVLQYVYEKYGPDRTGMVANVVTFRPRMAIRQVGAAMGFPETVIDKLSTHTDSWYLADVESTLASAGVDAGTTGPGGVAGGRRPGVFTEAGTEGPPRRQDPAVDVSTPTSQGLALSNHAWQQFVDILRRIEGTPRHLSIHVGGMLVTGEPLVDVVPVERATMPGRVVVQFDKDDIEDLGLIKMDLLGLRTLSAIAECLDLVEQTTGQRPDLDALLLEDQRVYDVICKVDTIGLFQIESRAQQQSLWQSQPRCFNDLIVQVAIIRPGPIQGDAVHPYLRRRQGLEPVTYLHPKLEPILAETCGVVLYQEQILRIVMEIAGYTAGEADRFRRAMNRHRSRVEMEELRDGFIRRCIEHDLDEPVAQQIFKSVAGFAEFGFCKSHAAAFARTAYETAWLRMTYPAHYTCALLNAQPMGFYHPSVLVDDAKRHGVRILPVDVTKSRARCRVEAVGPADFGIRLGFAYVRGLGPSARAACDDAVVAGANTSAADFWRHTLLPRVAMENLIRVGAFDAVAGGRSRRQLLWALKETEESLPPRRRRRATVTSADQSVAAAAVVTGPPRGSGAIAGNRLGDAPHTPHDPSTDTAPPLVSLPAPPPPLPAMDERTRVSTEYALTAVSTGPHLVSFMRERLTALGCVPLGEVRDLADGTRIRVAGLVITRQQPSTARGFRFFTLADEHAHLDLVFRPPVVQRTLEVSRHPLLMVDGRLQVEHGRVNVLVDAVTALTPDGDPIAHPGPAPPDTGFHGSHDYR
ncbi:MAG TPA: DNA polymerase III subunit alpha [Candidatus Saccharimonadales bacterium]|nr:DNA polymerase III subunit alpha [Candidatus Saccharimonadales bacterium]